MQSLRRHRWPLLWIALAAVVTYVPLLWQPLLEDDYPNILQARLYGPPTHWGAMFGDPIHRFRATTWVLTNALDQIAGPGAIPFHVLSVLLHIANAWLLYLLARSWRLIGPAAALAAAVFFALQEGHQEAVMWYSASNELLQALFGLACVLGWIRFWGDGQAGEHWRWYVLSLGSFAFALASKESAVILPALLLLFVPLINRKTWAYWLPFALLSAADILLILQARTYSFRFHDGSFELSAPFWITLPMSLGRLLWPWGLAAIAALFVWAAPPAARRVTGHTLAWMILTLLPYSFLTYMHRVPSRQTYLASAGLALLVGAGFAVCAERWQTRRALLTAAVALVVVVNVGTLWTRKRQQFLERAAPTEALAHYAQTTTGPVVVRCFPGPPIIAEAVLPLRAGRPTTDLVWRVGAQSQSEGGFCWTDKSSR